MARRSFEVGQEDLVTGAEPAGFKTGLDLARERGVAPPSPLTLVELTARVSRICEARGLHPVDDVARRVLGVRLRARLWAGASAWWGSGRARGGLWTVGVLASGVSARPESAGPADIGRPRITVWFRPSNDVELRPERVTWSLGEFEQVLNSLLPGRPDALPNGPSSRSRSLAATPSPSLSGAPTTSAETTHPLSTGGLVAVDWPSVCPECQGSNNEHREAVFFIGPSGSPEDPRTSKEAVCVAARASIRSGRIEQYTRDPSDSTGALVFSELYRKTGLLQLERRIRNGLLVVDFPIRDSVAVHHAASKLWDASFGRGGPKAKSTPAATTTEASA